MTTSRAFKQFVLKMWTDSVVVAYASPEAAPRRGDDRNSPWRKGPFGPYENAAKIEGF